MEAKTDQDCEPERDGVPEAGKPQQGTPKALVVDFETSEQEEKREPE
jgi:hypothetical protein